MKKPLKLTFGSDLPGFETCDWATDAYGSIEDGTVDEIRLFHVANKLPNSDFFPFFDRLYRILKPGAGIVSVTPYFKSVRAHIDPLAARCVSEGTYAYLNPAWRKVNKVTYPIKAKFDIIKTDYTINQAYKSRAQEAVQSAAISFWDVIDDLIVTLCKK